MARIESNKRTDRHAKAFSGRTSNYMLQLYLILVGLSFGFSIVALLADLSLGDFVRFFTLTIILFSWLHGQMPYEESTYYEYGGSLLYRLSEHFVELIEVLLLMVAALVQHSSFAFHQVVVAIFWTDLYSEVTYLLRVNKKESGANPRDIQLVRNWIVQDIVGGIFLTIVAIYEYFGNTELISLYSSLAVSIIVFLVAIWDYSKNRDVYFGLPIFSTRVIKRKRRINRIE